MNSRSVAVALVTIAMALSSVGGPLLAGDDGMPDPASSSPLGGSRAGPMSELAVNFSVRNPLGLARAPEVAWVNLSSPPGLLSDPSDIALLRRGTTTELLADHLPGDVRRHPDGSVSSVVLHFQDRWAPMETLDYTAVLGRRPSVQGNDMYYQSSGEFVIVRDSDVEYQVHIDDSIYSQYQGLYYLYIVNSPSRQLRAHGSALTRVGGNQLDPDQASFQMWWGRHTDIEVHRSSLVTRIELSYDRPEIAHWGPGGDPAQWIRNVDFLRAEVTLTFYSGIHRIDVHSKKVVSERFWNHNGFVMEFTAILGEGADWQGGFETVFGTDARIVMETTTQGPTWTRTTTQWQDVDAGADAAPALADLDGDGDLDMVMGSEDGNLTVWENVGTAADPQMTENASWAGGLPSVEGPTPALADLDADGDADLLLGERAGYLKVYRNEGGPSGPPSWTRWWGNFDRLGLGSATAPCFGDVDDDGDLDILVGLGDGAIKGIENVGGATSPSWDLHDRWVGHLNSGPTRSPAENYAVPHLADLDGDRDLDLLIGSDDGKVTYFENVGNSWNPRWTRLDLALFAGVATGTIWEGNSTPVMADLDDDGDADLLVGTHGGTLHHYRFDGWTTPYRGHNNLQPLLNDTYRHMRDKDGNDGCFVVEGYGHDFLGYYVLANPRNGYAALRYLPDFDRLAYKHEYYGDRFPAAGGNVSYYPYDAGATEYVTRAQITSNAMADGVSAGTFISQTGTSAGFVMQPMTAMAYESDEILVLDLVRQTDPAVYDRYADPLRAPLEVLLPANIVVEGLVTVPVAPALGEPATLVVTLANRGSTDLEGVAVEVEALIGSAPLPGDPLVATAVDLPAGSTRRLSLGLDTWWLAGEVTLRCIADPDDAVAESSESDNNANYAYTAGHDSLTWSDPIPATTHINTSLHPDAVVRGDGQLYVVWETCQNLEDIDIEGRAYDPATGAWGPKETLVTAAHYAVEPDLVAVGDQVHLAYSSNIVALENYYRTAHAKYYWGEKFDIYTMTWSGGSWSDPTRVTRAVDFDDADQAPDIVHGAGRLRVFFRNTHFDFYTNGNQMDNIPFQEMDVREASRDPASGWTSGNVTLSVTSGSQAWWGGPRAAAEGSDLVWVVYATEVGNSQWDLVAEARGSAGLVQRVDLARTSGSDEVRPAVAAANDDPSLVVAYEKVAGGNREIAIRRRSPGPNPSQGWRQEELVFPHPASDIKPSPKTATGPTGSRGSRPARATRTSSWRDGTTRVCMVPTRSPHIPAPTSSRS
jgi:hypothetical protein